MTFNDVMASNLFKDRLLPTTPLGDVIDQWAKQLTDEQRAAIIEHWKNLPTPRAPEADRLSSTRGGPASGRTQSPPLVQDAAPPLVGHAPIKVVDQWSRDSLKESPVHWRKNSE